MSEERINEAKRRKRISLVRACFAVTSLCALLLFYPKSCTSFLRSHTPPKELSNDFPSLQDSLEMARLSRLVYTFKHYTDCDCNATNSEGTPLLPKDLHCHLYHHDTQQGTQVMILSSTIKTYIAIVFAGTDDLRTTLTDTDILMKPFGPLDENGESILLPGPARVHAGFDNAVFQHELFERLVNITTKLLKKQPTYRLFTTGHSLGGANAILTAVALVQQQQQDFPHVNKITCINFGCPNVGNEHWRNAIHSLNDDSTFASLFSRKTQKTQLSIWRFVHGWDVVPRLPEYPFTHVGHTLQMNVDGMHAYYLHRGNVSLNYASVPYGWSAKPFIFLPVALWSHEIRKYQEYLRNISAVDPTRFYVSEFEAINATNGTAANDDDDGMMDDDAWINPPDDVLYDYDEWMMLQEQEEDMSGNDDDDDTSSGDDDDLVTLEWNEDVVVVEEEEVLDVQ